ncbi:hypothetical protein [Candidatus Symbiopectobacterium sp. 'North America']|uniref:hypothetical protein n=1 Tax=Candidatus Symbiopectobacterium sp. 'North America' TaxID=2794574 RepID=UPI0018C9968F|nr:hypothetical protein [Candidatus Symbiopectobacterium sp. 'North America']
MKRIDNPRIQLDESKPVIAADYYIFFNEKYHNAARGEEKESVPKSKPHWWFF